MRNSSISNINKAARVEPLWRAYWELCKPRVVMLMLLTVIVGMYLASPTAVSLSLVLAACVGIGLCAGAAAAVNHVVDQRIDRQMRRTHNRPLPTGRMTTRKALLFAMVLTLLGSLVLWLFVNRITLYLTLFTLLGYAVFYTMYLKRATPQNIVIGGLAGAAPPLLGWTAVTGHVDANALLLVLIIFVWTPPHFWALAIARYDDYVKANVPMLPVTHTINHTKLQIVLYTILLLTITTLPFLTGMSHGLYLLGSLGLGSRFLWWALKLYRHDSKLIAMQTFRFSITYLMLLFVVLLVDHYVY